MQARFSPPSSLAAHHRRLMASCADSGCPQVRQRSGATLSARTVGESLCISKSVEARYKGLIVSARDLPTPMSAAMFSGSPHSTRATTSGRTERQASSEAADEATGTRTPYEVDVRPRLVLLICAQCTANGIQHLLSPCCRRWASGPDLTISESCANRDWLFRCGW